MKLGPKGKGWQFPDTQKSARIKRIISTSDPINIIDGLEPSKIEDLAKEAYWKLRENHNRYLPYGWQGKDEEAYCVTFDSITNPTQMKVD